MSNSNNRNRRGFLGVLILVGIFITSLYMMTYSGRIESMDAVRVFDAASSLVHFDDWLRDESFHVVAPQGALSPGMDYPLERYELGEPLVPLVVSLFYRLSLAYDQWGAMHIAWLLNVVVGGLIATAFTVYARLLGYDMRVAVAGAVLLGVGTAIWVYSKTLFREPLTALMLLLVGIGVEGWRRKRLSVAGGAWLGLAFVSMVAAFLMKNSALFALPAVGGLLVLPDEWQSRPWLRRLFAAVLLIGLVTLVGMMVSEEFYRTIAQFVAPLIRPVGRLTLVARQALHTYLFSVGGSFWGTSPVLLLGLAGGWLWWRQEKLRLIAGVLLIILGYAAGHAVLTGGYWAGGLSWPPRFLIPIVPFAMLAVLPVLNYLRRAPVITRAAAGLVILYGVVVQVIAVASYRAAFIPLFPDEAAGLAEWLPGFNQIAYLRWVLLPRTWSALGFDVAWLRLDLLIYIIVFGGIALLSGWLLVWQRPRIQRIGAVVLGVVLMVAVGVSMRTLYRTDTYYWADKPALFEVLETLKRETTDGEPLLLAGDSAVTYERFVMNYLDTDAVRPIVTSFPPGEAVSPVRAPRVESHFPPDLLDWYIPRAIDYLANEHERIWLLDHVTPYLSYSVRPLEQYLSRYQYLVQIVETDDPTVRLLAFDTTRAPNRYLLELPEQQTSLRYGDHIRLDGVTLPKGTTYSAGERLPLTLFWSTDTPLATDYVVAWFVGREGELPAASGRNSMPDAGFRPTTTWEPDELIYDNRALTLPADIPAGDYQIWLVLYAADSGGNMRLPITEGAMADDGIGVLPMTLTITE